LNINFDESSLNRYGVMHFLNNTKTRSVFYFHDVI